MKYLIDDDLRERLLTILAASERWLTHRKVEELKHVEPLSNTVLWDMSADRFDESSYVEVITYARAIEKRILGETT